MDRIRIYLKSLAETEPTCVTIDGVIARYSEMVGFNWINATKDDDGLVHFPELETRSALEFIRLELTAEQVAVLDDIDTIYKRWIERGVFYKQYSNAWGGRFTWQGERDDIAEVLGRSIPKSHWWLWPPEDV